MQPVHTQETAAPNVPVVLQPGVITPLPGNRQTSRVRTLRVSGDVRIDFFSVGPHVFEAPACADPARTVPAQIVLLIPVSGSASGRVGRRPQLLQSRDGILFTNRFGVRSRSDAPFSALRLGLHEHLVAPELVPPADGAAVPVRPGAAMDGCVGLLSSLLDARVDHGPTDLATVRHLLIELASTLLCATSDRAPARARVERYSAYIEAHLGDRDLTPPSIAAAFGVSLRAVHAAFSSTDATVAQHIRRARLRRARGLLLTSDDPIGRIAERVGLLPDVFGRTFRLEHGESPQAWRQRARAAR